MSTRCTPHIDMLGSKYEYEDEGMDEHVEEGEEEGEKEAVDDDVEKGPISLTIGVVEQAISDIGRSLRLKDNPVKLQERTRIEADAYDFLLVRVKDPDNLWGQIMSQHGSQPITKDRIVKLATEGIWTEDPLKIKQRAYAKKAKVVKLEKVAKEAEAAKGNKKSRKQP